MSAISILHVSDLHYSPANLDESDRCLHAALESAKAQPPDVVVISGDSTDHRLEAHSSALLALASKIKAFSQIAPVLILQGTYSHEPPGTIEVFGLLSDKYPIAIANRICQIALTDAGAWQYSDAAVFGPHEVKMHSVKLVLTCVPTVNKANLAAALGSEFASAEMGKTIQTYLQGVGVRNREFAANNVPTAGVSHGTVQGCITEHGVPMMGFDHEFTSEALFDANCSAFLLGHIHKHQVWSKDGRLIAYPGSIGRFHYGEEGDKGYLRWNVRALDSECAFHVSPSRQMQHFDFDGLPDIDALKASAPSCSGAYVRVRWQVDQEHAQVCSRFQIQEIFACAKEVKIDIRILKIQRSRSEGINQEVTLANKLSRWAKLTNIDGDPIVERLHLLSTDSGVTIGSNIIADITSYESKLLETSPA